MLNTTNWRRMNQKPPIASSSYRSSHKVASNVSATESTRRWGRFVISVNPYLERAVLIVDDERYASLLHGVGDDPGTGADLKQRNGEGASTPRSAHGECAQAPR